MWLYCRLTVKLAKKTAPPKSDAVDLVLYCFYQLRDEPPPPPLPPPKPRPPPPPRPPPRKISSSRMRVKKPPSKRLSTIRKPITPKANSKSSRPEPVFFAVGKREPDISPRSAPYYSLGQFWLRQPYNPAKYPCCNYRP